MTGRMYPEKISQLAAVVTFIGFNLTFFPQFILGTLGMPRRYAAYPPEFQILNVFSTAGATILGVGYLLPILYLTWSLKYGEIAGNNPWQATGLGVADAVAAADRELPRDSDHGPRSLRLRVAGAPERKRGSQCRIAPAVAHGAPAAAHHEHPPYQRHHFETVEQQTDATNFAMWLFLLTEIMFFGGLFTAYLIYRNWYYPAFVAGLAPVEYWLGHGEYRGADYFQLHHGHGRVVRGDAEARGRWSFAWCSRSSWAWSFSASRPSSTQRRWEKHHVPGFHYSVQSFVNPASDPEVYKEYHDKPLALDMARHTELYFFLYFAMTGMHALHMIIGIAILGFMIFRAQSRSVHHWACHVC